MKPLPESPTSLKYLLSRVEEMLAERQSELTALTKHGNSLQFGSAEYDCNSFRREFVAGQIMSLAVVSGTIEARIQIDEIWAGVEAK